jgi:NTP pyrophosphatase (non-canonical NTP hydrolase)
MIVRFTDNEVAAMYAAAEKWGLNAQCDQTIEECAELIVALGKHVKRSLGTDSLDKVLDEIADVEMMLAQMRLMLGIDDQALRERIEQKFEKMNHYLESES